MTAAKKPKPLKMEARRRGNRVVVSRVTRTGETEVLELTPAEARDLITALLGVRIER